MTCRHAFLASCVLAGLVEGNVMKEWILREWWPTAGCAPEKEPVASVVIAEQDECRYLASSKYLGSAEATSSKVYVKHTCNATYYSKMYFTDDACTVASTDSAFAVHAGSFHESALHQTENLIACSAENAYDGYQTFTCGKRIRSVTFELYTDAECTKQDEIEQTKFVVPHKQCNHMAGGSSSWALQGNKLTHNSYPDKDDCSGSTDDRDGSWEITWECGDMNTHINRYAKLTSAARGDAGSALLALSLPLAAMMATYLT